MDILSAHAYAGMKDFKKAITVLGEQNTKLTSRWNDIFGEEGKKWLKFSLLYAYAEIYFDKGDDQQQKWLSQLLQYTQENESSFQYPSMYANVKSLLAKIGEPGKIDQLTTPKR